jgi:hypothetical protein
MNPSRPIFLFTDFGWSGPYVGQMVGAIVSADPLARVFNLMHDAPQVRPDLAAYLLPACCRALPQDAVVVAVVDPGVGGDRAALIVETATMTFVGPDNGLLSRLPKIRWVARIDWRPASLSASFHGRDLFAPVAARLALGETVECTPIQPQQMVGGDWPDDLEQIIYIDAFGNLMTGVNAKKLSKNRIIVAGGQRLSYAETFCRVAAGAPFWYVNSQGLVEIAANGRSAATLLSLALGKRFLVH